MQLTSAIKHNREGSPSWVLPSLLTVIVGFDSRSSLVGIRAKLKQDTLVESGAISSPLPNAPAHHPWVSISLRPCYPLWAVNLNECICIAQWQWHPPGRRDYSLKLLSIWWGCHAAMGAEIIRHMYLSTPHQEDDENKLSFKFIYGFVLPITDVFWIIQRHLTVSLTYLHSSALCRKWKMVWLHPLLFSYSGKKKNLSGLFVFL